jgi:hypothetical protein
MKPIINKKILILLFIIGVFGCSSFEEKEQVKFFSDNCKQYENANQNYWWDVKILETETSKFESYYEPSKIFSGIQSVKLKNTKLTINFKNKILYEEYKAPIVDRVRQTTYKLSGCIEKDKAVSGSDRTKKIKTGKTKWKDIEMMHKIKILGFDKEYQFVVDSKSSNEIDLNNVMIEKNINANIVIEIICESCNLLGESEKKLYTGITDRVSININELIKIEDNSIKNQKINQVINNIDDLKHKCTELGFKPNSEKFGKCILELTK